MLNAPAIIQPANIDIEQALLGGILLNNSAYDRVADFLEPNHFFLTPHVRIFEVIAGLIRAGRTVTPTILKTYLPPDLRVDGTRNVDDYLNFLLQAGTYILNIPEYGKTIFDLAIRRELMAITEEARVKAANATPDVEPRQQLEDLERKLFALSTGNIGDRGFAPFSTAAGEAIERARLAQGRSGGLAGLSTGLIDVDEIMGGLQASDLLILAGRPGMGKSALASNISYAVARAQQQREDNRGGVAFFSLEMSREQLANRIIAEQAGISSDRIRRGMIDEQELARVESAGVYLQSLPFYIDDTGGLSLSQLALRARRLKRRYDIALVVVDYLQLMRGSSRKQNDNRVMEVTEITAGLKALAKELNVPVLALSQLSRAVEMREDKRPQLADLRESGSIEQDADVVMFLYREAYYLNLREPRSGDGAKYMEWQNSMDAAEGIAEIIVAKNRHGATNAVRAQFDPALTRFSNLARARD